MQHHRAHFVYADNIWKTVRTLYGWYSGMFVHYLGIFTMSLILNLAEFLHEERKVVPVF